MSDESDDTLSGCSTVIALLRHPREAKSERMQTHASQCVSEIIQCDRCAIEMTATEKRERAKSHALPASRTDTLF